MFILQNCTFSTFFISTSTALGPSLRSTRICHFPVEFLVFSYSIKQSIYTKARVSLAATRQPGSYFTWRMSRKDL